MSQPATIDREATHECDSDCLVIRGIHHDYSAIYTHAENCRACEQEAYEASYARDVFLAPEAYRRAIDNDAFFAFFVNLHKAVLADRIVRFRELAQYADDLPFE